MMNSKLTLSVVVWALGLLLCSTGMGLSQELSGRDIMDRTRAMDTVGDMQMDLEMRIINQRGQQRVRSLTMSSLRGDDGTDYSLIRFTSPADVRGVGFLSIQQADGSNESWIYLPALGRERRMTSDERGGSFMGSDFTVEDISLDLNDYTFALSETTTLAGLEVYVVTAHPINEELEEQTGVSQRTYYVCTERFVSLRMESVDTEGSVVRVMTSEDFVEAADGLWVPLRSEMRNLQANTRTEMTYSNVQVNPGLTESDFSRRQLTRAR